MIAALLRRFPSIGRAMACAGLLWSAGAQAAELTIATYNVENYGPANRMTEAGYRENYPKPEAEKAALRAVIRAVNADVLALQEMGAQAHLDELRRDLKNEGCDYPYAALANAADADRRVALLSKLPLQEARTLAELNFSYFGATERVKRGVLQARVQTEAGEVTLFVVHLKSRYTDRADDPESDTRRTLEAAAVRDAVLRQFPNPAAARFALLGDCNDTKGSKALARLQRRGETAVLRLVPAADARGETWTHVYRKEDTYSRVDYVLLSPGLLSQVEARARIYDGEGVAEASDHRPVVATLRFK